MARRARFRQPLPPGRNPNHLLRIIPTGGVNYADGPEFIQSDESPFMTNWELGRGRRTIRTRAGIALVSSTLSSVRVPFTSSSSARWIPLGYHTYSQDSTGKQYWAIMSTRSVFLARSDSTMWEAHALADPVGGSDTRSADYFDTTEFVDSGLSRYLVMTNEIAMPQWVEPDGLASVNKAVINLSADSFGKYCESFDERLLVFNSVSSQSVRHPTRLHWTVRGQVDFSDQDGGAGFTDLADMEGDGVGMMKDKGSLYLFSEKEVWAGRPRRDAFAFDFNRIHNNVGVIWPRTLARTDVGPMWVGPGPDVYTLVQGQVVRVGKKIAPFLDEFTSNSSLSAHALFDEDTKTYKLFLGSRSVVTDNSFREALYLHTDTLRPSRRWRGEVEGVWMHQSFNRNYTPHIGKDKYVVLHDDTGNTAEVDMAKFDSTASKDIHYDAIDANGTQSRAIFPTWTSPALETEHPDNYIAPTKVFVTARFPGTTTGSAGSVKLKMHVLESHDTTASITSYTPPGYDMDSINTSNWTTLHFPLRATAKPRVYLRLLKDDLVNDVQIERMEIQDFRVELRTYTGRHA